MQQWPPLRWNTWEVAVVVLSDLNLNVFKWGNCQFLIFFLRVVGLDYLAVGLKLVPAETELFETIAVIGVVDAGGQWRWQQGSLCCSSRGC